MGLAPLIQWAGPDRPPSILLEFRYASLACLLPLFHLSRDGGAVVIDWWDEVDRLFLEHLVANGPMTPAELAKAAGVSEGEATAFLAMLAREGRIRICLVAAA
jgi:hypothetical protein